MRLGSRALDILIVLTRHAGEVVGKDELIAQVWPDMTVEETNLRVHIAALRKALRDGQAGNRFIANIPGRGYSFVAPIVEAASTTPESGLGASRDKPVRPSVAGNLPAALPHIHGRAEVIERLVATLPQRRLITVVGPGGIGKTTVALAAAEGLAAQFSDGAIFVDFAPIADPLLVPSVIAAAIGLAPGGIELGDALGDRTVLLLLDSCEHVVEAVATLAETLLRSAPKLAILATSREPLRADGEWVERLAPLGLPPQLPALTAAEALGFPAVQLFVERAAARLGGFELTDADAPVVAEVCRRLDGIALAIEFAAGRLDAFSLRELAALLDDRFEVLTRGRRTALPRHQTLRATLDWSYGILPEMERLILRRLSVFRGAFTLAAAREVAGPGISPADFGEALAALVFKSLLAAELSDAEPQYRMFETTRVYARERLDECGEAAATLRGHADYYRRLFERAELDWQSRPTSAWVAEHARHIDDLRAALGWAFGPDGDRELSVALALLGLPLWLQLSLVEECLGWVEKALAARDLAASGQAELRQALRLNAAAGWLQMHAPDRLAESAATWQGVLRLAEQLGDVDYQSRALWALWVDRMNGADFREGLRLAQRFRDLTAATPVQAGDALVGERLMGSALHFIGDQQGARAHVERMLVQYRALQPGSHVVRFQFHQRVSARITLARVLWVQGFADRALGEVADNVRDAIALDHRMTLCNALAQSACPVALLVGDAEAAERYTAMLQECAVSHALEVWHAYVEGFRGELLRRRGDAEAGLQRIAAAVQSLRRAGFVQHLTFFLMIQAQGLLQAGRPGEALVVTEDALARCAATGEGWALAELKRIRAEALLAATGTAATAEATLREALDTARAQGALAWELRAASSLAALWLAQGRKVDACALIGPLLARFTEGFESADLRRAAQLLECRVAA